LDLAFAEKAPLQAFDQVSFGKTLGKCCQELHSNQCFQQDVVHTLEVPTELDWVVVDMVVGLEIAPRG
jgi:hypothetical protein